MALHLLLLSMILKFIFVFQVIWMCFILFSTFDEQLATSSFRHLIFIYLHSLTHSSDLRTHHLKTIIYDVRVFIFKFFRLLLLSIFLGLEVVYVIIFSFNL